MRVASRCACPRLATDAPLARFCARSPPDGAQLVGDEARLLLYALYQQARALMTARAWRSPASPISPYPDATPALPAFPRQATLGACSAPKPWAWNVVESAKWSSWSALRAMEAPEAMRLYVRALEQDNADWWALLTAGGAQEAVAAAAAAAAAGAAGGAGGAVGPGGGAGAGRGLDAARAPRGEWAPVASSGTRPRRRFEAAAAATGGRLLVAGGRSNGRALGDAHLLDLATLTWRPLPIRPAAIEGDEAAAGDAPDSVATRAGAAAAAYGDALLLVGGQPRRSGAGAPPPALEVLLLAPDGTLRRLATRGEAPGARAGHTAHVLGDTLWVLGGEDARRRPCADVARLHLRTGQWEARVPCAGPAPPSPRVGHCSAERGGVIYLFGGIAPGGACVATLAALDTTASPPAWHAPRCAGAAPAPRAGAAGALLGDTWFVAGGGDGVASRRDTVAMRLPADGAALAASPPLRWRVVAEAQPRSAMASEGIAMVALPATGALLAFGGYNGAYSDDLSLLVPNLHDLDAADDDADDVAVNGAMTTPNARTSGREELMGERARALSYVSEGDETASPPQPVQAASPARASAGTPRRPPPSPAAASPPAVAELRSALDAERQRADGAEAAAKALRASLDDAHMRVMRAEAEAAELRGQLAAAKQYVADLEAEIRAIAAEDDAQPTPPPRRGGFLAYVTGS
jgi:acyl-CoA-binding protein